MQRTLIPADHDGELGRRAILQLCKAREEKRRCRCALTEPEDAIWPGNNKSINGLWGLTGASLQFNT